ncbi:MAG: glycosyltransferase [Oscillospiraceae bacterium]|jgi:hypothetical protein|nr:glycosyltransferase [Oscillospiraceae bacterium]
MKNYEPASMPPLVTVIVPVFNAEPYLRQCLDSILTQSYKNLEILLVDDGSSDASGGICDAYAQKDARVRALHRANAGPSAARNAGLDFARGAYILFADADDWLAPTLAEVLVQRAIATNADLVQCRVFDVEADGANPRLNPLVNAPDTLEQLEITAQNRAGVYLRYLYPYVWACPWGRLLRTAALQGLRFVDTPLRSDEDAIFFFCLFATLRRVEAVQEALYYYRQVPGSLTHSALRAPRKIAQRLLLVQEFERYLKQDHQNAGLRKAVVPMAAFVFIRYAYLECRFADAPEVRTAGEAELRKLRRRPGFRGYFLRAAVGRAMHTYSKAKGTGLAEELFNRVLALGYALGGLDFLYTLRTKIAPQAKEVASP